ncbi:hypothetical protein [Flagellimonas profundi]|uniref:Uncharacterized protein n=1 Tax=Flagellimonas profundi TaxID=2915620 RepID=A0ABS3FCS0_9FLAO|nr:hypothetical protein [Allomuricauda profundi]MBO0340948.1 hypothetical protein [Allomuricauda profundi]
MELIKLKVKEQTATGASAKNIANSFIEACVMLDAAILDSLIEEDKYFDDLDKYRFLAFLSKQFDSAKAKGLNKMIVKTGRCHFCARGHSTYEFYGKDSKPEFAYVVEIKNGVVKNILNCNLSSGWGY